MQHSRPSGCTAMSPWRCECVAAGVPCQSTLSRRETLLDMVRAVHATLEPELRSPRPSSTGPPPGFRSPAGRSSPPTFSNNCRSWPIPGSSRTSGPRSMAWPTGSSATTSRSSSGDLRTDDAVDARPGDSRPSPFRCAVASRWSARWSGVDRAVSNARAGTGDHGPHGARCAAEPGRFRARHGASAQACRGAVGHRRPDPALQRALPQRGAAARDAARSPKQASTFSAIHRSGWLQIDQR